MYTKGILFSGISPNKMQGALRCEMLVEWAFCYIFKNSHDNCQMPTGYHNKFFIKNIF